MQYPQQPQISIEVATNGFLMRIQGNSPQSLVFATIAEAVPEIEKQADDYRKNLTEWMEFQTNRLKPPQPAQKPTA